MSMVEIVLVLLERSLLYSVSDIFRGGGQIVVNGVMSQAEKISLITVQMFGPIFPSPIPQRPRRSYTCSVEISGNSPAAHPDFSREPSQTGEGYRCSPTYLSTSMYTNRITAMK